MDDEDEEARVRDVYSEENAPLGDDESGEDLHDANAALPMGCDKDFLNNRLKSFAATTQFCHTSTGSPRASWQARASQWTTRKKWGRG